MTSYRGLPLLAGEWVFRHPVLLWAIVSLSLLVVLHTSNAQYDSGNIEGFLVITSGLWAWMYWLPSELMFELNDGKGVLSHEAISVAFGLILSVLIDMIWNRARAHYSVDRGRRD